MKKALKDFEHHQGFDIVKRQLFTFSKGLVLLSCRLPKLLKCIQNQFL
jgi:hypothetical protein